jgi:Flp pilus assembly protein TadG
MRHGRHSHFRSDDGGQAIIIVGLVMVVLLAAVALGLDWGYGLTQRRVMQSAADGASLAAGKQLAVSVIAIPGAGNSTNYVFSTTQESVYCKAKSIADANISFGAAAITLRLEFGTVSNPGNPATWDPPAWQTFSGSTSCPASTTVTTQVDPATRFVRVTTSESFRSIYGSVSSGAAALTASASARTRLTGTAIPAQGGPTWPMVRHYDPSEFVNDCVTGQTCSDPTKAAPMTFWSSGGPDSSWSVFGNFKGATDFSTYSTYYPYSPGSASNVRQLMTAADSGTKADKAGGSCAATWDATGDHTPSNNDSTCDVPNWFYYSFGGSLAIDTPWGTAAKPLPAGQSTLVGLGNRSSICPTPSYITAPSCGAGNDKLGDWVEATGGDIGSNYGGIMKQRINDQGSVNDYSSLPYPNKNQPCVDPGLPTESNCYGKALTVDVYLWDCAEDYNGGTWAPIAATSTSNDCSQLDSTGNKIIGSGRPGTSGDVARVHLFAIAPFTFYEALVNNSSIQGFWGGAFGNANSCPSCVLNPLSNSAYLVGD